MIAMLPWMARSLFKSDESIATRCYVKASGRDRRPTWPDLEIAIFDFKMKLLPFHLSEPGFS